jgi:hypothetical protein
MDSERTASDLSHPAFSRWEASNDINTNLPNPELRKSVIIQPASRLLKARPRGEGGKLMSAALDRIIEEVKTLTPEERRKLLAHLTQGERTAELRRIQSKYAHMKTSSDAFAARKQEEIELEDRRP